jgi:hypothetical protein
VEEFGGKTKSHTLYIDRFPGEGALTLRERCCAKYRELYGLAGRIVTVELGIGSEGGAA